MLFHHRGRATKLLERRRRTAMARDADGKRTELSGELLAVGGAGIVQRTAAIPEIHAIRQMMLIGESTMGSDHAEIGVRRPCLAVATPPWRRTAPISLPCSPCLIHIRRDTRRTRSRDRGCLSGAALSVPLPEREASFGTGVSRSSSPRLRGDGLSDGTLRYLGAGRCVAVAPARRSSWRSTSRRAACIPDLLEPLARLIAQASERTQIWLVTIPSVAAALASTAESADAHQQDGETWIESLQQIGRFNDEDE